MNFSTLWWPFALIIIGSYLMGSTNNAIIITKLLGKDIRGVGSGNPGTMNVSRNFGLKIGALVLFLDILKGVIPTLVATLAFKGKYFEFSTLPVSVMAKYMSGFFVVLGHIFPAFYKLKGGKGIATTVGVFLVCNFVIAAIFGVVAIAFILVTRIGSMGSFIATTPPAIWSCLELYNDYFLKEPVIEYALTYFIFANMFILGIVALTWVAHRENIKRLLSGDEHPTEWLQMFRDRKLKKSKQHPSEEESE